MDAGAGRLAGKTALVTGAAQGIGRGIAELFAAEKATIVIADIQSDLGRQVARGIAIKGGIADCVGVDIAKEANIDRMIDFAVERFGRLDILVNNAAPSRKPYESMEASLADWDGHMDILLKAQALAANRALPHLAKNNGSIVNISSIAAFLITHQTCDYHVAKAGILQLTRYLAYEFGPEGVRVNCICPGVVDRDASPHLTDDATNRSVVDLTVPLKRAGTSRDLANAALFLCSDAASYITGQALVVDGGLTLGEHFGVVRDVYRRLSEKSDEGKTA